MLATVVDCQQIHHMILNVILRAAYVHGVRGKKFFIYNLSRSQGTPVTAAIFFAVTAKSGITFPYMALFCSCIV